MKKIKNPNLGETLFIISYFLLFLGLTRIKQPLIHYADATRLAVLIHFLGVWIGGSRRGGMALVTWATPWITKPNFFIALYVAWSAFWGWIALLNHWGLHTGDFDVGIYGQTLLHLSQGKGYLQFLEEPNSFLGDHQNFLLPLFAPLFWTPWGTELLLITQSFLLFLPGLLLALWIRNHLPTKHHPNAWAWIVFLGWMQATPLIRNTFWEWHETALTVPLLTLWAWSLAFGRRNLFFAAGLLAGLTKQNLLITLLPGIFLFPFLHYFKTPRFGFFHWKLIRPFLGIGFAHLAVFVFDRLVLSEMDYAQIRYAWLGTSTGEILLTVLTRPDRWIPVLFESERLEFLNDTIRHTGYGALFSGWMTLAWIPPYLSHVLAGHKPHYSTFYHYVLEFFPIAYVAAIRFWIEGLRQWKSATLWTSLTFILVWWPLSEHPWSRFQYFWPDASINRPVVRSIRSEIENYQAQCGKKPVGIASQWIFAQFFEDYPLYPVQAIERVSKKPGFQEIFLEQTEGCRFLIGESKDFLRILPELSGTFNLKKKFTTLGWGKPVEYVLYLSVPGTPPRPEAP